METHETGDELISVLKKIAAARAAKKATLKGVDLMQWNLNAKLRDWIVRETGYRCVNVGEVCEKVAKYAPKTILKNRAEFERAVKDLWRAAHETQSKKMIICVKI